MSLWRSGDGLQWGPRVAAGRVRPAPSRNASSVAHDACRGVDSLEFLDALRDKGYNKLVIQKGNGAYCPHVIVPAGQSQAITKGVAVE